VITEDGELPLGSIAPPSGMKEALNRPISIDLSKPLTKEQSDRIKSIFPLEDPQIYEALKLLAEKANDMTILQVLKALPVKTITPENLIPTLRNWNPKPAQKIDAGSVINVLWYGGNLNYNNKIAQLAATAHTFDPWGDGALNWNLSFFNAGDPTPNFSAYDVFIVGTGWNYYAGFNSARLLTDEVAAGVKAARGNRTFLSGQDADLHYILGAGGRPGTSADGPFGFLVNAVNWAASGKGMGLVLLPNFDNNWWMDQKSFLRDEFTNAQSNHGARIIAGLIEEKVIIPTERAKSPINEGLTTSGLSNWYTSAHTGFTNMPGYVSINDAGSYAGNSVTLISASEADGGTQGKIEEAPEPTTVFGTLAFGALAARWRSKGKRQQKSVNSNVS